MPVWHEKVQDLVDSGQLNVVCVIQEQHVDRCRLFLQWKQIPWKVLHDPINLLGSTAVPIFTAIDEHGVVRHKNPTPDWIRTTFLTKQYPKPKETAATINSPAKTALRTPPPEGQSFQSWQDYADSLVLWGKTSDIDVAIKGYRAALDHDKANAATMFRLGAAYRLRYDSPERRPDDFLNAAKLWHAALEADPNHYIYRRRIQQYGPRLDKPYSFYDWIAQARREVAARGETPYAIAVEPGGAELAHPTRKFGSDSDSETEPDPTDRIRVDRKAMISHSVVVVPPRIEPEKTTCVHIEFEPFQSHWTNEAGPATVWIRAPMGWSLSKQHFLLTNEHQAESEESRKIDFEVQPPAGAKSTTLEAYILYYACHESDGVCIYGRRNIEIPSVITQQ